MTLSESSTGGFHVVERVDLPAAAAAAAAAEDNIPKDTK